MSYLDDGSSGVWRDLKLILTAPIQAPHRGQTPVLT